MNAFGNLFKPQSFSVNHYQNLKKCFLSVLLVLVDVPSQNCLVH